VGKKERTTSRYKSTDADTRGSDIGFMASSNVESLEERRVEYMRCREASEGAVR
jgi:hypothetical protein